MTAGKEQMEIKNLLADFLSSKVEGQAADALRPDFVPVHQILLYFANLNGEAYGLL